MNEIIEFGAVKVNEDLKILDTFEGETSLSTSNYATRLGVC